MPKLLDTEVGPIGYGMMGLTWQSSPLPSRHEALKLLGTALEYGSNFWNAGEFYGTPESNSLHLLNEYFTQHPEAASKIFLSIKGAMDPLTYKPDCSADGIKRSVEQCLKVLDGKKSIDIFECARADSSVQIEDTIAVLAEFVKDRKIRGIGLSEVSPETIRRAHAVHPIAAVELELSLWTTDILQNGIASTCAELGIPIIAYAPLNRGALSGNFAKKNSDIPAQRRGYPKFQDEVLQRNLRLSQEVEKLAASKGCSSGQVALAWIKALPEFKGLGTMIPIPGAEKEAWIRQNCADVSLTMADMQRMEVILQENQTVGDRSLPQFAQFLEVK